MICLLNYFCYHKSTAGVVGEISKPCRILWVNKDTCDECCDSAGVPDADPQHVAPEEGPDLQRARRGHAARALRALLRRLLTPPHLIPTSVLAPSTDTSVRDKKRIKVKDALISMSTSCTAMNMLAHEANRGK